MNGKLKKLISLFAGMMLLVSCGDVNGGKADAAKQDVNLSELEQKYPVAYKNEGEVVPVDTLKVAVVSGSPYKGIFNGFLYSSGIDNEFMQYTMNGAFPTNPDFTLVLDSDETPIKVTVNPEEKTVTYKINPNFKWSNGDPVTTKDIVKTYEIFANQDYITSAKSLRFSKNRKAIVGIEEYNEGKADKISGLEVIDDSTMKIHLKEITPSVYWGGNFAGEFINAKQFEGVPMDKIIESPALRRSPLSYGPYYIKDIVQGEKVIFEANPYYYRGEPKIKTIEMEILPPSQQVAAIKSGKYDIVFSPELNIFPEIENLDNIVPVKQKDTDTKYASVLQKSMGNIDFSKDRDYIERLVRGLSPWPGAYSSLRGKNIKLLKVSKVDVANIKYKKEDYGRLISTKNNLYVVCKGGLLEILNLQLAGKKAMQSSEFLRGFKPEEDWLKRG